MLPENKACLRSPIIKIIQTLLRIKPLQCPHTRRNRNFYSKAPTHPKCNSLSFEKLVHKPLSKLSVAGLTDAVKTGQGASSQAGQVFMVIQRVAQSLQSIFVQIAWNQHKSSVDPPFQTLSQGRLMQSQLC